MAEALQDSRETRALLDRLRAGDGAALDELLARHRPLMVAFVEMRLDADLRPRVDPSDVVQLAQKEMVSRMDDYQRRRPMPFHLWARKTAYERLLDVRKYERRRKRAPDREQALPERSSVLLARPLLARTPAEEAEAREMAARVAAAVAGLPQADQEILLMRQGEGLPFAEIACLLDIDPAAARKRFGRALIRLQRVLSAQGLLGDEP